MEETILTKIREEHEEMNHLLNQVENSKDYFQRLELFNKVKSILVAHMTAEEKTIYKRFRHDVQAPASKELARLSDREHHEIKEYIQRLNLINFGSNDWLAVFKSFKETVKRHGDDEELNMFAEAKEDFSREELIEIAADFEEAKSHSL